MGLNVYVYRWKLGDCTNGGISQMASQLCIVNIDGPSDPSDKVPAVILTTNGLGNPILRPATQRIREENGNEIFDYVEDESRWYMMGGNYAASSDSRFGEAVRKFAPGFYGALPIHDRAEF